MDQRPQNVHLGVNKTGKHIRKSIFDQVHANALSHMMQPQPQPQPQPKPQPTPQVYIVNKNDFKTLVQQLTSCHPSERLPQNPPQPQKTKPEPINRTTPVPPVAPTVQDDPQVSMYMSYLQSLLEDSSESNDDPFQQPFDEYHQSYMVAQPQVPQQAMPQSYGYEPVMPTTPFSSSWFDGSTQQMHDAYSLQPTRVEYPQPLTPDFTFSSTNEAGVFDPDLDWF